jgi:RNA-dependent RNA polymerase
LDREQAALIENVGRGLGLMGQWQGVEDWYGGRVQQQAEVVQLNDGTYQFVLLPPEMRKSCLFGRFLGSRRLIRIRLPKKTKDTDLKLKDFLKGKHVLCGRVFVALFPKDG